MDVEKTIEFILEQQARLETMMIDRVAFEARMTEMMVDQRAIAARTDARLDRAIRLGVQELRRERLRRQRTDQQVEDLRRKLSELSDTVDRYIQSRGNGHNLN